MPTIKQVLLLPYLCTRNQDTAPFNETLKQRVGILNIETG